MKTIVSNRLAGQLLGGDNCCWLRLEGQQNQIDPDPLRLGDGTLVPPGTKFFRMGSHKTSAGFTIIDMYEGH